MHPDNIMLITGTRKGIGRFLSEYYLEKGFHVFGCSRGESNLAHERYRHFCLDVSDEKSVKQLFFDLYKSHQRLDVLINNAGVASMNHSLLTPLKTVRKIFETNLFGTFLFCREAAKIMKKGQSGRIVNFSTVATPLKLEGEAVYAASKAAILSLTEILAREFSPYNITVNSVGPTPVETDLIKAVPPQKMERLLRRQAIPRFGTFEDIANVIDFYIKEESSFITGQNIYLGGV
ncbi:MAG: SDR family oxidoreductase [Desulfobacteraceae bacterium]|nr:MAG: SDR family oxidoreductase [Desulfobacteraceae bacterium]